MNDLNLSVLVHCRCRGSCRRGGSRVVTGGIVPALDFPFVMNGVPIPVAIDARLKFCSSFGTRKGVSLSAKIGVNDRIHVNLR